MISIRRAIADTINEQRNTSWYGSVTEHDIVRAEVRHGCAEIEVTFSHGDEEHTDTIIPVEPALTALLQWAIDGEGCETR